MKTEASDEKNGKFKKIKKIILTPCNLAKMW